MSEISFEQLEHIEQMYARLKGTGNMDLALVIGLKASIEKLERCVAEHKASLADARETLAQAWVAVCGTGCATTGPTGTERPHTLLCNQIRAALHAPSTEKEKM